MAEETNPFLCSICLEVDKKDVKILDKCQHAFCVSCIDKWFEVRKTCPLCKHDYGETSLKFLSERFSRLNEDMQRIVASIRSAEAREHFPVWSPEVIAAHLRAHPDGVPFWTTTASLEASRSLLEGDEVVFRREILGVQQNGVFVPMDPAGGVGEWSNRVD